MSKTTKIIAALGVVAGLGVAALPLTSYAANESVTLTVTVDPAISLSHSGTTSLTIAPNNADLTTASSTLRVSTNNLKGYKLTVNDADADASLVHATQNDKKIVTTTATPAAGTSSWAVQAGAAYTGMGAGLNTTWTKMPNNTETPLVIRNSGAVTSAITNESSVLKYGVGVADGQEAGVYSTQIVFTAVSNN